MSTPENTALLKAALEALQPVGVVSSAAVCVNVGAKLAYAEEAAHMSRAAAHRKDEFATGRDCARAALQGFGVAAGAILPDREGVPLWPERYLGSISHSRGLCAAIAARSEGYICLGLDLEKTNRLSVAAMKRVVHADERAWVQGDQVRASLLFSAKEAFYKAQYPHWRSLANFHDLSLWVDADKGEARIQAITGQFPEALRERVEQFRLSYRFFGDYVVALCWLARGVDAPGGGDAGE